MLKFPGRTNIWSVLHKQQVFFCVNWKKLSTSSLNFNNHKLTPTTSVVWSTTKKTSAQSPPLCSGRWACLLATNWYESPHRSPWYEPVDGVFRGLLILHLSGRNSESCYESWGHKKRYRNAISPPKCIQMDTTFFSRKTFRRRVLQKIVCVSHTTHIPHISSTSHISHTYPFQTYPPHISHTYPAHRTYPTHIHSKRIPPIRIPPVRIHAMRIHSKGCNTYPTNHHTYPIHIQHIIHIPHISIPNVSLPNVSHQYVSIANVSIQKVCISRNRKRIPPIHIPPIRIFNTYPTSTDPFNAYPFKKFASAGMAMSMMSMSITANHFIPLLLGGNGNEYKNFAFPSILCKIINWIYSNCIARVWTCNSLLAIGLPACLPVVCFCACFLIIFYYSIPPGGMGRVNRKATLSLKTRRRSPKTVAKRKFHFLAANPLAKNASSIARNCGETQISFSRGQPSR